MTGTPDSRTRTADGPDGGDHPARRRVLRATATLAAAGLAGCAGIEGNSGDGGDDGGSGGDGATPTERPPGGTTPTAAATTEPPTEGGGVEGSIGPMCEGTEDSVEGLAVVGCGSAVEDDLFVVTVTVHNEGGQDADLFEYDLRAKFYDSTDTSFTNEIEAGTWKTQYPEGSELPSGERMRARVEFEPGGVSAEAIEAYVVTLECGGFGDGVYCE